MSKLADYMMIDTKLTSPAERFTLYAIFTP
jgi:hypothetical protein